MADKIVIQKETLDRLGANFQESRGITDKLTIEQMIEFAKEPVGGNKLAQLADGSLTEITAADLKGITKIAAYAFYYCGNLYTVILPDTIKSIDEHAFERTNLREITIPNNSVINILANAFTYCTQLTHITLPEGLIGLGNGIFSNCTKLENVSLPNSITYIPNGMFYQCGKLKNVILPNNITSIGNQAFMYCYALTDMIIPNSVSSIGTTAFAQDSALTTIRIGNGITSIASNAFNNSTALTDIYIDKPEGSVSGAPWGATNATVHWNTPLPSNS